MHLLPRTSVTVSLCLVVLFALGGCGNPLEDALKGVWRGVDGLTIEFEGDTAVVTDFGNSPLGTNRSVFDTGDAFIQDIECDDTECLGQIINPTFVDGSLASYTRTVVSIETEGTLLTLRSQALSGSVAQFTQSSGGDEDDDGGASSLQQSASCPQWWAAVKAGGPWTVIEVSDNGTTGAPSQTVRLTFSGTDHYTLTNSVAVGEAPANGGTDTFGDIIFTENFSGYCRFAFWSQGQNQVRVWFMRSLSNKRLEVKLSTGAGETPRWVLQGS